MHTAKRKISVCSFTRQAGRSRSGLCCSLDAGQDGQYTCKPCLLYHAPKDIPSENEKKLPYNKFLCYKIEIQILSQ